jgi:beta-glucosidase
VAAKVGAILYAWHPGSMAGPAVADLLLGTAAPSGRLPITLPRMTGQIPIYYAHKRTGKPATPESFVHLDDLDPDSPQLSVGNTSFHFDAGYTPLFAFGHGLSYTTFEYTGITASPPALAPGSRIAVSAVVHNTGDREAEEVVQLYVGDLVASVTRPVRELKGFQRVRLAPGERRRVSFTLGEADLAFHGRDLRLRTEAGQFHAWIGGSSEAELGIGFELLEEP